MLTVEPTEMGVPIKDLLDGELAVIVKHQSPKYIGRIIQVFFDVAYCIGFPSTEHWSQCSRLTSEFRVKVLPKGTLLRIE